MSVSRCKQETTSMDFVKWRYFLEEQEINGFHRNDLNFARLCSIIHNTNADKKNQKKEDEFLIKLTRKRAEGPATQEDLRLKMLMSRGAWASALGIKIPTDDLVPSVDDSEPS